MTENQNKGKNPRVFISYSWDSPEHKLWVESFAQELRKSGIDARLDAWRDESQSIDDFMMVELERADFVLAICTPRFKQKIVENAEGTATASGFEIGTAAALRRMGGKDVIPVLREGEWTEAAPSSLLSYRFYDFTQPDVSEEFTQLRDRLLGHIRRPPELGVASGPAAAPELPDIFAKGSSPEPQPTAPPPAAAEIPRSGPGSEPETQQPQAAALPPRKAGYSKGKVWGIVGAVIAALAVLLYMTPDTEEQPGVAANGQASNASATAGTRWNRVPGDSGCGIENQVAPGSWVQLIYLVDSDSYELGTADDAWGEHAQTGELYQSGFIFRFDDDESTAFIADVVGYDYDGIPGAYVYTDDDIVGKLAAYNYLNVYLNVEPYSDNRIMRFSLAGSADAAAWLMDCVEGL